MILTNEQIYGANLALNKIKDTKMSGKLVFKLYKLKKKLEDESLVINEVVSKKDISDNEIEEVLNMENEIEIDKIDQIDLEGIDLSLKELSYLECIINFTDIDEKEGD